VSGPETSYRIGEATSGEMPYVWRTWVRDYRYAASMGRMPYRAYCDWQRDMIDRLTDSGAVILVARDVERPVYLYGFLCAQRVGDAVVAHYANVRRDWQGQGIARSLLGEAIERIGDGAEELLYTADADRTVELGAEERAKTGRRTGVDTRLTRKLEALGMQRVAIEELLREPREAA
jgi:GNAT superfamily N-acetyltransferase